MDMPGSAPIAHAPGPLKKVPKWAVLGVTGVAVGLAVRKWKGNKGTVAPSDQQTATGDAGLTGQSFPAGGTVTSGAAGDAGYSGGNGAGSQVDIPGLIDAIGNTLAINRPAEPDWATIFGNLPGYAGGGGTPQSGATGAGPAPQDQAPTPAAPSPAAAPTAPAPPVFTPQPVNPAPPAFQVVPSVFTEDNGKRGAARRVWCTEQIKHVYPNRAPVVVSSRKLHDGGC